MTADPIVVSADRFAATAAQLIAELVEHGITSHGSCSLALSGGSSPVPIYHDLVGRAIHWSDVIVLFGDERAVPPDDPASNYGMARRALLDRVPIAPQRVHRMEAERPDRDAAAREYARLLPPRIDVLLLGLGPDGHTASLFPGAPSLHETERRVLAVPPPELPIQPQLDRMTITPPVIAAAQHVVMMVDDGAKAGIVAEVLEGADNPSQCPGQLARHGTWILTDAAASHLSNGKR